MTALDVRVRRSARRGLISTLEDDAWLDEEAEDAILEITEIYRQTRRSVEEYAAHPFAGRITVKAECGTDGGYHRHRREGAPACDECKAAHTVAVKSRPSYLAKHAA